MSMNNLDKYVPEVYFEKIPIKNLVSNQNYQRDISMHRVEETAAAFDLYQINPVKVSRRDNVNYVFDGQHTIEIVAMVSGSRETPVWCMIYDDLKYEHEADIFANQAKHTRAVGPYDTFIANIEAGSNKQILIKETVENFGMKIRQSSRPGAICAVGALERIYDLYGLEIMERTLYLIIGTWEGVPSSFSGNILNGVASLLYAFKDKINDELFKERCGKDSIKEICREAKSRRSGSMGYAETLLNLYNRKSQYRLYVDTLHSEVRNAKKILKMKKIKEFEEATEAINESNDDAKNDQLSESG